MTTLAGLAILFAIIATVGIAIVVNSKKESSGFPESRKREGRLVRDEFIAGTKAGTRGKAIGLAVAVFASGWVLAIIFAGLWIYERRIF